MEPRPSLVRSRLCRSCPLTLRSLASRFHAKRQLRLPSSGPALSFQQWIFPPREAPPKGSRPSSGPLKACVPVSVSTENLLLAAAATLLFFSKTEQNRPDQALSLALLPQSIQSVRYLQLAKLAPPPWSLPRALSCRVPCASRHFSLNRPPTPPVPRLHLCRAPIPPNDSTRLDSTRLVSVCLSVCLCARLHRYASICISITTRARQPASVIQTRHQTGTQRHECRDPTKIRLSAACPFVDTLDPTRRTLQPVWTQ